MKLIFCALLLISGTVHAGVKIEKISAGNVHYSDGSIGVIPPVLDKPSKQFCERTINRIHDLNWGTHDADRQRYPQEALCADTYLEGWAYKHESDGGGLNEGFLLCAAVQHCENN